MDATDPATYGSDRHGLVWGYRFLPGHPGEPIDTDGAAAWLAGEGPASGGFLWLHFSLANAASAQWLQRTTALPPGFYESLQEAVGSTRLEQEDDTLVAVLHDLLFDFTFDPADVSTVTLGVSPGLVVSARLRPLRSLDQLRNAVKTGERFRSPTELLATLLRAQASVLVEIVRKTTARVDDIEDKLLANRVAVTRQQLGALRRLLVRLQRLLAPEPAALFRLLSRPPRWITEADLQDLREAAEEFSTAVTDSALLVERVKLLQEELTSSVNEQTNRTLFVLTLVTVMALPINLVAGLFGMNVGGIPLAESRHGFALIVVTLVAATGTLLWVALQRNRS